MIFRSPYPDVAISELPLTAYTLRHAERLADKTAVIDASSGRRLTHGQLAGEVRSVAAGLQQRGFGKGDVFGIYATNSIEYAVALLAVASIGGVTTTVNPLSTGEELARQLTDAGATRLLTVPELFDRVWEATASTAVREFYVTGEADGATPFAELGRSGGSPEEVACSPDDVVLLPYSSGTTGLPKGVMITHSAWVANLCMHDVPHRVTPDDVVFCLLPFFHIYGAHILALVLQGGGTLLLMPRFDLTTFLASVERERATRAYLAPPVVLALANHPDVDQFDLTSLICILSGGAPLGAELTRRCQERLGCSALQGYGLTETCAPTHIVPVSGRLVKPGSIGPCMPNTESRIVDIETGADLCPCERGELWVRGPQIMKGYLNRPEATAAMITPDGWLRTGDVAYVDEDGDFYIVDRLKELIKYKAYQVAPAELEAVLLSHPAVADAAVVPFPDDAAGEVPKAWVVLKGEASADELMAFVAARVAPYKKVRQVEFVELIPKSPSGKILRRLLVERDRAAMLVPA